MYIERARSKSLRKNPIHSAAVRFKKTNTTTKRVLLRRDETLLQIIFIEFNTTARSCSGTFYKHKNIVTVCTTTACDDVNNTVEFYLASFMNSKIYVIFFPNPYFFFDHLCAMIGKKSDVKETCGANVILRVRNKFRTPRESLS